MDQEQRSTAYLGKAGALAAILTTSAMMQNSDGGFPHPYSDRRNPTAPPPPKVLPKGTQEFCFDHRGNITDRPAEIRFKTVAINLASARKKYNKWYQQNFTR